MKKSVFVLFLLFAFATSFVGAQRNNNNIQQPQTQEQEKGNPQKENNQGQNQNKIKTQNQGESQQIQTQNQEQEGDLETQQKNGDNRNSNAQEHMSNVAIQVHQLLQTREQGGIGEQVRVIAQEQNQAQTRIQEYVEKMSARGKIKRFLIGPDYTSIKSLSEQIAQNQTRIQQLESLKIQLTNQNDINQVQATIEALIQQNTVLQEQINTEKQSVSLFGWFFRLL